MPPPERAGRHQTAVLWRKEGEDRFSEASFDDPEELTVRWEWRREVRHRPDGQPVGIDALVIVTEEVPLGSLLWKGTLEAFEDETAGSIRLMEAVTYEEIPDIKGRHTLRELGLIRFKGSVP